MTNDRNRKTSPELASARCPECGAALPRAMTCQDILYRMLALEYQHPSAFGAVHHLTVMCYNLQHPNAFTDAFWHATAAQLTEVVEQNLPVAYLRQRGKRAWTPARRLFKITGTPTESHRTSWPMCIDAIVTEDPQEYVAHVQAWARVIVQAIQAESSQK